MAKISMILILFLIIAACIGKPFDSNKKGQFIDKYYKNLLYVTVLEEVELPRNRMKRDTCDSSSILNFSVGGVSMADKACEASCKISGYKTGQCLFNSCTCHNIVL